MTEKDDLVYHHAKVYNFQKLTILIYFHFAEP